MSKKPKQHQSTPQRPIPVLPKSEDRPMGVQWLLAAWCALLVLGFLTIRINGALAANNQVSVVRAIFTSVNTSTLTGFTQTYAKPIDFQLPVQYVLAMQTLMGTLLSLVTGGALLNRALGRNHKESDITAVAMILLAIALVVGAATGDSAWSAITGLSALGNSGLIFESAPAPRGTPLLGALLPLAWIGSLGTVVILDIWKWLTKKEAWPAASVRMVSVSLAVYLISVSILLVLINKIEPTWYLRLIDATRIAVNTPNLGFATELPSNWPHAVQWVAMGLMVVGTGTIGTNGGLGVALLASFPNSMRTILLRNLAYFWGSAFIILLIILQTEPTLSPDRALMLVLSAASNSGISHEPIGITGEYSLPALSILMVLGRLMPLAMLTQICEEKSE